MNAYYQYFLATGKTTEGASMPLAPTLDPRVPTAPSSPTLDPSAPTGGGSGGGYPEAPVLDPVLEPSLEPSTSTNGDTNTTKPVTNIYIQDGLLSGGSTMIPLPTAELETPIGDGVGGSGGGGGGFGGGGGMPSGDGAKGAAMLPFGKTIIPLVVIAAGVGMLILKPIK
jgi:hypothetical protein